MTDISTQVADIRELTVDELELVSGAADGEASCTTDLSTGATKCTIMAKVHF